MTTMSKADRERMYTEYLRVEGYRPELDQDGQVKFFRRTLAYTIFLDDDDAYFAVGIPCWTIENEEVRTRVRKAALHANDTVKVARVSVHPKFAYAQVSTFIRPPEGFKAVFDRIMQSLDRIIEVFVEAMEQKQP